MYDEYCNKVAEMLVKRYEIKMSPNTESLNHVWSLRKQNTTNLRYYFHNVKIVSSNFI